MDGIADRVRHSASAFIILFAKIKHAERNTK